ncbi:hypothetical protein BG004_006869 [Podila humilis]|nr:hypothetical protein BG004_006869 [Podila humilis]
MKFNTAVIALVALVVPAMAAKTWDVNFANGKFTPQDLDILAGDTVRWPNDDGAEHAIVETGAPNPSCTSKAGGFNSGSKTKGQAYQRTFSQNSTVTYKDGIGANCQNGAYGTIYVGPRPAGAPKPNETTKASTTTGTSTATGTTTGTSTATGTPTNQPSAAVGLSVEKSLFLGVACLLGALVF